MHIYIILCHHIFCSQCQKLFLCADKCDKHRCEHCGYYDCLETEKCMWTSESDDGWMAEGPYGVCKPKGNNRLCNKGRAQQKSIKGGGVDLYLSLERSSENTIIQNQFQSTQIFFFQFSIFY